MTEWDFTKANFSHLDAGSFFKHQIIIKIKSERQSLSLEFGERWVQAVYLCRWKETRLDFLLNVESQ